MKEKIEKFMEALEEYGEMYFSQGSIKKDYEYIKNVLDFQGYYSGCRYRLYFNKDFDLIKVEERF
jgi:hypothetical protein